MIIIMLFEQHWNAVKRIMRYLSYTKHLGILYSKCKNLNLIGFSDSDYASDIDTRPLTSGYVFKLSNEPITWMSKRQACESKYCRSRIYCSKSCGKGINMD